MIALHGCWPLTCDKTSSAALMTHLSWINGRTENLCLLCAQHHHHRPVRADNPDIISNSCARDQREFFQIKVAQAEEKGRLWTRVGDVHGGREDDWLTDSAPLISNPCGDVTKAISKEARCWVLAQPGGQCSSQDATFAQPGINFLPIASLR